MEVPAKRVQREHPVYEMVEVEVVEPVLESGQPTGRFAKVKRRVPGKKIGTRMVDHLVPDKDGSETKKVPKYGPGGPAAWAVNLPGLNGMALYVLVKAGLGEHPETVKQAGMLPKETNRLAIRSKKIHPPAKTEAVVKAAAKRMAAAIDEDGGATALAFVADNTGFDKTGFPAPDFASPDAMPPMFGYQTACTTVAAQETLVSLAAVDPAVEKQLVEPRTRAHERTEQIAARWYRESANPAADAWKGMHAPLKVSHADLKKSGVLEVPAPSDTAVESLPWGPSGSLYRIVPGFRGLFAGSEAKARFENDLFRQIAYRLVALQDHNGQWSSAGNQLLSTASESLLIGRIAKLWHASLNGNPPVKIGVADPVTYESMLHVHRHGGWSSHPAALPDAGVFPTLASLLFLLEATDRPVSLEGITILPPPSTEPPKEADPDKPPPRLTPVEAVRGVPRPNAPRQELFDAMVATRWPRKAAPAEPTAPAKPATNKPEQKPAAEKEETPEEDDGLGTFEDLLQPADDTK